MKSWRNIAVCAVIGGLVAGPGFAQDDDAYREEILDGHRVRTYSESRRVQTPELTYRVIQVKKGDTLSGIAAKYFWPVLHEINKETISDPDRIYPGQWLVVPSVRAPVIRVEPVERISQKVLAGVIYASDGAARFRTGTDELLLSTGDDIVGTGRLDVDAGFLTLRTMDGARLRVFPYSSVDLLAIPDKGEDSPLALSLVRGRVLLVGPDGGLRNFRIKMPALEIAGKAGNVGARVDTDSGVQVENYAGEVKVWVGRKSVDVPAGHGFVSNVEASDWEVRKLPEGTDSLSAEIDPNGPEVTFRWRAVKGATGYLFTLAKDKELTRILTRTEVPARAEYTMGLYNAGQYYWRVQPIDEKGLTGPWSATHTLIVGAPTATGNSAAQ